MQCVSLLVGEALALSQSPLLSTLCVCVCVCLCVCVCVCARALMCAHSVMSDSLWSHGLKSTSFLCPWDSPGKNIGAGCHFLLQGIFLTQGLNPCLLLLPVLQVVSLLLSHQGRLLWIYYCSQLLFVGDGRVGGGPTFLLLNQHRSQSQSLLRLLKELFSQMLYADKAVNNF